MKQQRQDRAIEGELAKPKVKVRWLTGTLYVEPEELARSMSFKRALKQVADLRKKDQGSGSA